MNVTIELMNASSDSGLPALEDFQHWTEAAMIALQQFDDLFVPDSPELSIRVIDEDESADLNIHYRQKSGPTNILSFPFSTIQGTDISLLGDIAICAPLVRKEAVEQDKTLEAHWAHLTIHGVLHLNGFDHEEAQAAKEMETLETDILKTLGYADPYQE